MKKEAIVVLLLFFTLILFSNMAVGQCSAGTCSGGGTSNVVSPGTSTIPIPGSRPYILGGFTIKTEFWWDDGGDPRYGIGGGAPKFVSIDPITLKGTWTGTLSTRGDDGGSRRDTDVTLTDSSWDKNNMILSLTLRNDNAFFPKVTVSTVAGCYKCVCEGIIVGDQCCGDDEGGNFCNGQSEGCFNEEYFTDPDKNQYVCQTCSTSTWANNRCCGDDSGENFCSGKSAGCFDAKFFNDPDNNQYVCETCSQGTWLNNRCCGDDSGQDTWGSGSGELGVSCFEGKVIVTCNIQENDKTIVNENGILYSCDVDRSGDNIQKMSKCTSRCAGSLFCSYTGNWVENLEGQRSYASTWPLEADLKTECCQENSCWNGNSCTENQKNNPISQPIEGFRCIDGEWRNAIELCGIENCETVGYCPEAGQCLVSLDGNPDDNNNPDANPQCISTGQYIKDNYCEQGNWTSRTKFIALQLISLAEDQYTLFCDNYENSLNTVSYLVGQEEAESLITSGTNNFCVMSYDDKIVFGTSLNQDINNADLPFLDILEIDDCNVFDDDNYYPCDNSNKAWYNSRVKAIIYSRDAIILGESGFFSSLLRDPFITIINLIKSLISEPPYDNSYVSVLRKFDKLYLSRVGDKAIRGTMEGLQFKNMVVEYQNFETNICNFVNQFNTTTGDLGSGIVCEKDGNNYYVLAQGSSFTNLDPEDIWTDLTSSLRIQ